MELLVWGGHEVTCVAKLRDTLDMIGTRHFSALLIAEEIEDSEAFDFILGVHGEQPELLVFQLSVWRSELAETQLEVGFEIATTNKRGVTFRNSREGGQQERSLAQMYCEWADRRATRWPRASAVLRSLSRGYENQGRMEDESFQRWDLQT
jgi:hypothetical protein